MIHYLSNDDDTGTEYGNNGAAPTKKSDTKMLVGFLTPPSPKSMLVTYIEEILTLILQNAQSSQYLVCFGIQYTVWISKLATRTAMLRQCYFNQSDISNIDLGGGEGDW